MLTSDLFNENWSPYLLSVNSWLIFFNSQNSIVENKKIPEQKKISQDYCLGEGVGGKNLVLKSDFS